LKVYVVIVNWEWEGYEIRKAFTERERAVLFAKETAVKESTPYQQGYRHNYDGVSVLEVECDEA
jgi:hypothetical protein